MTDVRCEVLTEREIRGLLERAVPLAYVRRESRTGTWLVVTMRTSASRLLGRPLSAFELEEALHRALRGVAHEVIVEDGPPRLLARVRVGSA